ncbi:MAG: hypothetical protein C4547_12290 [Phycisphaerales bacterium]|nr:MAG: hypothetical protein C4547_12290 [Phycisphaerales bacterium]
MYRYLILSASAAALCLPALTAVAQPEPSDPVCSNGGEGKPEICVRFDNREDPPAVGTDFRFDFDDPDNPGIEFIRGSDGQISREWRIWSWDDIENQTPKNIGTLIGNNSWNFDIKIAQPDDDPGADDLNEVLLGSGQIGDHWSKVEAGSITGDLPDGATFSLHRYNDSGGYANFTINGNLGQGVEIVLGQGQGFTVKGDAAHVNDYITVDIEDGIHDGNFTIEGTVIRTIVNVYGSITNGAFQIGEAPDQLFLTVNEMGASGALNFGVQLVTYEEETQTADIRIKSDLPSTASINAPAYRLFGTITFEDDANPPNRKDVYGNITLETFGGAIEARNLSGTIDIARSFEPYQLGPGLQLTGSMSGRLNVNSSEGNYVYYADVDIDGDLTSDGEIRIYAGTNGEFDDEASINIDGDLAGTVFVGGDFAGDVSVGDDFTTNGEFSVGSETTPADVVDGASFTAASNARGDFLVSGNVADEAMLHLNKLGADGRILIDGTCAGDILIDEDTNATSLIQIIGGLMQYGSIVINQDENDAFDANGDIFIGNPLTCQNCELDIVYYDGVINILNGTSSGGDLNGDITVVGCHVTNDPLQLCVCGSETGSKTIVQTDCDPQVPGFTCSSNPCN